MREALFRNSRRTATTIGAIVLTALVGAASTVVVSDPFGWFSQALDPETPVRWAYLEEVSRSPYALPEPVNGGPPPNAIRAGVTDVKLRLTGMSRSGVTIHAARIKVLSTAPPVSGALYVPYGPQGDGEEVDAVADLDAPDSPLLASTAAGVDADIDARKPLLDTALYLKFGETRLIDLHARTTAFTVTWAVEIEAETSNGSRRTVYLGPSAPLSTTPQLPINRYEDVFVQDRPNGRAMMWQRVSDIDSFCRASESRVPCR